MGNVMGNEEMRALDRRLGAGRRARRVERRNSICTYWTALALLYLVLERAGCC